MFSFLRKIGKGFILLRQKDAAQIRQSILLIDSSFILPNNFALIIKDVKEKFKNANLVALTFQDKKEFIRNNFPEVEMVVVKKFQLAIQLLFLLRRDFSFLILSSLDISTILVSLVFGRCQIFLHNRWFEWYRIRQRTLLDILKRARSTDRNRRAKNYGIRDIIKSFGRIFAILSNVNAEEIKSRILIQDNGYTEIGHVITAVQRSQEVFINPDITILTFTRRKQDFINNFVQPKLVIAEESRNRYRLAIQMYRIRKYKFNYIVLTTLDISPIAVSFLFFRAKVLLYNRWHQWWSLELRNIWGYLKEILIFLAMIPILVYLFLTAAFILLRTNFRLGSINIKSIIAKKR